MIKVVIEKGKAPVVVQAYDSPNDKDLSAIAHIIADTIDLSKYINKNNDSEQVNGNGKKTCNRKRNKS